MATYDFALYTCNCIMVRWHPVPRYQDCVKCIYCTGSSSGFMQSCTLSELLTYGMLLSPEQGCLPSESLQIARFLRLFQALFTTSLLVVTCATWRLLAYTVVLSCLLCEQTATPQRLFADDWSLSPLTGRATPERNCSKGHFRLPPMQWQACIPGTA